MATTESSPGIRVPLAIIVIALAIRFVPGLIAPFTLLHFLSLAIGPAFGLLGLLIWWTFARRVRWRDRLVGAGSALATLVIVVLFSHRTMANVLMLNALPIALLLVAIGLLVTRPLPWSRRRYALAIGLALAMVPTLIFRMDGQIGALDPELALRWTPTAEDRFLADQQQAPTTTGAASIDWSDVVSEWPGFRGPARDGSVRGVRFGTDWDSQPPRELWRRRVGPAWSSFAVAGGLAMTQEQRGAQEVVVAYDLDDGHEIWVHARDERFEEPQAGPGPRATPTYDDGQLFALGAGGTLSGLDAATGREQWSASLVADLDAPVPPWGFSSSPLVIGQAVIVFAGASDGRSVAAFDRDDGRLLWTGGDGRFSYASAQAALLGGLLQVLMVTELGLESFAPDDGAPLWHYDWPVPQSPRIVLPVALPDGESLIFPTGYGEGTRRLTVRRDAGGEWVVSEAWSSRFLKPYFNDAVCHEDHCYGFDGRILTCIDATDGERCWKGGRYGHGQIALLTELDLLLVLSEQGEVVLVEASPAAHREVARLPAIEGKTWNHPVIADGKLLLRNAREAVCFELPASIDERASK